MARRGGERFRTALLAFLTRTMLRVLRLTTRKRFGPGTSVAIDAIASPEPIILAFWHGDLALLQLAYPDRNLCVQISRHGDGEIIARAIAPLGIRAARVSASGGGAAGVRGFMSAFEEGFNLGMAVDGPHGPRHRVKEGVIVLAARTGAAIYPIAASARPGLRASSRDRFAVPLPLARIIYEAAEPIRVDRDAGSEEIAATRTILEKSLLRLTHRLASSDRHRVSRRGEASGMHTGPGNRV